MWSQGGEEGRVVVVGGLDPVQGAPNQLVPASSTLIWAASNRQPTHSHSLSFTLASAPQISCWTDATVQRYGDSRRKLASGSSSIVLTPLHAAYWRQELPAPMASFSTAGSKGFYRAFYTPPDSQHVQSNITRILRNWKSISGPNIM